MSFVTDLRGMTEAAVSQLTDRFGDLPRPLLAAIGAGDFAVERLAEMRTALTAALDRRAAETTADARELAADLPTKVQEAAHDVLLSVQRLAGDLPDRTQHLVDQLPGKLAEVREALSPEQLKSAVDSYAQLAAVIYGSLAGRGDKKVATVVGTAADPDPAPTAVRPPRTSTAPTAAVRPTHRKATAGTPQRAPRRAPAAAHRTSTVTPTVNPAPAGDDGGVTPAG